MPPNALSRHRHCAAFPDPEGRLFLEDREPFFYVDLPDNREHHCAGGETLAAVAAVEYFGFVRRPNGLWWVLADFQPEPIFDTTLVMEPGAVLVVPSERTVAERILSETRRLG